MPIHRLKPIFFTALLTLLPSQLHSAEITWGTPQNVTDESDISTSGRLVEAVNAATRSSGGTRTVNGVLFEKRRLLSSGSFFIDFDPDGNSTLSGDYAEVMSDADFGGGTDTTITLGGGELLAGFEYEVQVWFLDKRIPSRVMTFSDGDGDVTTADLDGAVGQYATGTFTADGTSQSLRLRPNGFNNAHINAYQVRLLSPAQEVTTLTDELDTPAGADLSLREALRDAQESSLILFSPSLNGELIQLNAELGELVVDKSLVIDASNLSNGIIIDGGSNGDFVKNTNETRCFFISNSNHSNLLDVFFRNLIIQNGVFEGDGDGGNIFSNENLTLIDCEVRNGLLFGELMFSPQRGAGIFNEPGNLTLTNCMVSGNKNLSGQGGGIFTQNGDLTMSACTINNNESGNDGAGICTQNVHLTMSNCMVSENQSDSGRGGGIFIEGVATLTNCTIARNKAHNGQGGGLYRRQLIGDTVSLTRCTIVENTALNAAGGGIANNSGILLIDHCTIVGNTAADNEGGGVMSLAFNNVETAISHSIVRDNGSGPDLALLFFNGGTSNSFTFSGENLIGTVGTGISGITPNTAPLLLAPLANYGGPTETMPPLPGSPAIDTALTSQSNRDQRDFGIQVGEIIQPAAALKTPSAKGVRTIEQIPDIGAAEFQGEVQELELAFDTDGDGDGLSVGLELFIGSEPFITDFDNPNRPRLEILNNRPVLTFGRVDTPLFTTMIVERSETLLLESFDEVAFIDSSDSGPVTFTAKRLAGPGNQPDIDVQINPDSVVITDNIPSDKAFYRLRAIFED